MGELALFFYTLSAIFLIFLFLLLYKNGKVMKNNISMIFISFFILFLGIITFTAFPSNFHFKIIVSFIFTIIGLIGTVLYFKDNNKFNISRIFILISIICNFILLIF